MEDVVLLDRAELTSGSTFHSAGLVGQLRGSVTLTRMMMYGVELYRRLAAETGVDPSWHEVGSLRLASSTARFEELQRQAGWARTFGLPIELITADEARDRFPLMATDGVLGALWLPTDGWLDPSNLAFALAAGARRRGVRIRNHHRVIGIGVRDGRVTGVEVEHDGERSTIEAEVVVNAGGMYAPEIGRLAGITLPIIPMAHQYLLTGPIDGRRARAAPAARPGQPRLLPRGGRRPVHGRLRAGPDAVGASTASRPTSTTACSTRTGRASSRSWPARSGACPPSPTPRSRG